MATDLGGTFGILERAQCLSECQIDTFIYNALYRRAIAVNWSHWTGIFTGA